MASKTKFALCSLPSNHTSLHRINPKVDSIEQKSNYTFLCRLLFCLAAIMLAGEYQLSTLYKSKQPQPQQQHHSNAFKAPYWKWSAVVRIVNYCLCLFFLSFLNYRQMHKWLQFRFCHSSFIVNSLLLILIWRTITEEVSISSSLFIWAVCQTVVSCVLPSLSFSRCLSDEKLFHCYLKIVYWRWVAWRQNKSNENATESPFIRKMQWKFTMRKWK